MFGFSKKRGGQSTIIPPVDLNKPVENPEVVAAITAAANSQSPLLFAALTCALRDANYLVPIMQEGMVTSPTGVEGQMTIQAGSHINVFTCAAPDGGTLLPLFTDWDEIRRWIDHPVSTLVMPAKEAFAFASMDEYAGAVVNPGGQAVELNKDLLGRLLSDA
jgi:hypothetical protein